MRLDELIQANRFEISMVRSWLSRVGYICSPVKEYTDTGSYRDAAAKLSFVAKPDRSGSIQPPLDKEIMCYIAHDRIKRDDIVVISIDGVEEEFEDAKPALNFLKLVFKKQKEESE